MHLLFIYLALIIPSGTASADLAIESIAGQYIVAEVDFNFSDAPEFRKRTSESLLGTIYDFDASLAFSITSKDGVIDKGSYEINENNLVLYFPQKTIDYERPVRSYYIVVDQSEKKLLLSQSLDDALEVTITLVKATKSH